VGSELASQNLKLIVPMPGLKKPGENSFVLVTVSMLSDALKTSKN